MTDEPKFPPARLTDESDEDFSARGETAWAALTVDQKLDWADGHDIYTLDVDGVVYDVKTREPR